MVCFKTTLSLLRQTAVATFALLVLAAPYSYAGNENEGGCPPTNLQNLFHEVTIKDGVEIQGAQANAPITRTAKRVNDFIEKYRDMPKKHGLREEEPAIYQVYQRNQKNVLFLAGLSDLVKDIIEKHAEPSAETKLGSIAKRLNTFIATHGDAPQSKGSRADEQRLRQLYYTYRNDFLFFEALSDKTKETMNEDYIQKRSAAATRLNEFIEKHRETPKHSGTKEEENAVYQLLRIYQKDPLFLAELSDSAKNSLSKPPVQLKSATKLAAKVAVKPTQTVTVKNPRPVRDKLPVVAAKRINAFVEKHGETPRQNGVWPEENDLYKLSLIYRQDPLFLETLSTRVKDAQNKRVAQLHAEEVATAARHVGNFILNYNDVPKSGQTRSKNELALYQTYAKYHRDPLFTARLPEQAQELIRQLPHREEHTVQAVTAKRLNEFVEKYRGVPQHQGTHDGETSLFKAYRTHHQDPVFWATLSDDAKEAISNDFVQTRETAAKALNEFVEKHGRAPKNIDAPHDERALSRAYYKYRTDPIFLEPLSQKAKEVLKLK